MRSEVRSANRPDRPGWKRGKSGRLFDYGEFRHVVLTLLAEQPRHGYDIIRAIEQRTHGAYCPSPGIVYPTLALLEEIGHARALAGQGARNRYEITPQGLAFLRDNRPQMDGILSRMQNLRSIPIGASPVIVAAMDNLKAALRSGVSPWSDIEAQAVAAAIDVAAERIRGLRRSAGSANGKTKNRRGAMKHSEAQITTERASIYLQQLCKHFAHRLPVEFTPERGQITFSAGTCRLSADAGVLTLHAEAADDTQLAQLQDVIARHLLRFAFRDPPTITWTARPQ